MVTSVFLLCIKLGWASCPKTIACSDSFPPLYCKTFWHLRTGPPVGMEDSETQQSVLISIRATDVLHRSSLVVFVVSPWGSCWWPGDIQNSCCYFHSGWLYTDPVGWQCSCFPFGARHGAEKFGISLERKTGFKIQRLY